MNQYIFPILWLILAGLAAAKGVQEFPRPPAKTHDYFISGQSGLTQIDMTINSTCVLRASDMPKVHQVVVQKLKTLGCPADKIVITCLYELASP